MNEDHSGRAAEYCDAQGETIEPSVMNTEVSICAIRMRTASRCENSAGSGRVSDPTDAEPRGGDAGEATTAIALFFPLAVSVTQRSMKNGLAE
jgi:hypothetical protein